MKSKRLTSIFVLVALGGMTLTGCATSSRTGAAVGGVGGAGLGAMISAATGGNAWLGALIGGAVGSVAGALIAPELERSRAEAVAHSHYKPKHGHRLIVEEAEVVPTIARPGDEVRVKVRYSVLAPDPQATIPVTETWQFLFKNHPVGEPIRKPTHNKVQGGYSSTYKFKVTPDFPPGNYHVLVTINNGRMSRSIGRSFSI
jgi:hypothetical protein